jgi:uncharacterized protein YbjT (DUF2867 family)
MNEEQTRILITGATGSTGSALATALAARGVPFRAMVRKLGDEARISAAPAAVATGNFDDDQSLASALEGITHTYLVTPSSEDAEAQQLRFVDQAAASGVEHIVLLSQLGAVEDSPVRFLRYHAVVERRIRELGIGYTFLRPNLFFQGLLAFAPMIAADGRFFAPIGDARVSAVDVRDIGDVAAAALTEEGHVGQTYTLTGPAALAHTEMAEAFAAALGRPITFSDAPAEQFAGMLTGILPEWQIEGTIEDYAHYRRGEAAEVSDAVPAVTGHPARDFQSFARDHVAAFR